MKRKYLAASICVLAGMLWWASVHCKPKDDELIVVVTDISAEQFFCSCSPDLVKKYDALRISMNSSLKRPVRFVYMTDFNFDALPYEQARQIQACHIIIGKNSSLEYICKELEINSERIALLTGMNASTDIAGVWITKARHGVENISGLNGKRLSIGMPWHAEKHSNALAQLQEKGIVPGHVTKNLLCKNSVTDVATGTSDAAVISDYATALFEDTKITHGIEMKVIGQTSPCPYISVFATERLTEDEAKKIQSYFLQDTCDNAALLAALKSKNGFVLAPAVQK